MLLSGGSITILCLPEGDCTNANLRITIGMVFFLWSCVFVLLLLQLVGLTKCLRQCPKTLFGFYFMVCIVMYFTQVELWGGEDPESCMDEKPLLYWWLTANVIIFYSVVAFGFCIFGTYICKVADAAEELTKKAVDDYLKEKKRDRHYMIEAGSSQPMLVQSN